MRARMNDPGGALSLGGGLRPPAEPPPNSGSRGRSPRSKGTNTGGELITVRVQARARRNEIVTQSDGAFRVRVTAAPEGEAPRTGR